MMTGWFSRWYSRKAARVIVTNATLGMTFEDGAATSTIALIALNMALWKRAPFLLNHVPRTVTTTADHCSMCAPVYNARWLVHVAVGPGYRVLPDSVTDRLTVRTDTARPHSWPIPWRIPSC